MDDWKFRARCDLRDATDIAGSNHIRPQAFDRIDFTLAQSRCNGGLKNVVDSRGAAAKMTFRNILHGEAKRREKLLRLAPNLLSVLQ
jgi:hypothetical protein